MLAAVLPLTSVNAPNNEVELTRRVNAFLTIKDYPSAMQQAKEGLTAFPKSSLLQQAWIRALAKAGDDREALLAWINYHQSFEKEIQNRTLEDIAWSVLNKSKDSPSLLLRFYSMVAALLTQDIQAVDLLYSQMTNSNSVMRMIAVNLAAYLGDEPLRKKIEQLVKEEKNTDVRLAAIKSAGKLRIHSLKQTLQKIVADEKSRFEEKAASIEALVTMMDAIEKDELLKLIKSDRAGLRLLACEIITSEIGDESIDADMVKPLLSDSNPLVRAAACEFYGLKIVPYDQNIIDRLIRDPDPCVSIMATWCLYQQDPERAEKLMEPWINHQCANIRLKAACTLAHAGSNAVTQMKSILKNHQDVFVKANIAIGLIGMRESIEESCLCLYELLLDKRLLMMDESQRFTAVSLSSLRHSELIPSYPEAIDQMTRLKLLNILAILHSPFAKEGITTFLEQRNWGVTGMASATLLEEGDAESAELVRSCLNSESPQVRIQAALVLASWLKDKGALLVLQNAYTEVDRETKIKILEAIGNIGDADAIPFLIERLQESFQAERIVSAFAIIRCLNH